MTERDAVVEIARLVKGAEGRALLVGGCVRDALMGRDVADLDVEVFGLDGDALTKLLSKRFDLDLVGASFGIVKLKHLDVDVALPRRETKLGLGHKAFATACDPSLSVKDAAARRDFTVNAMYRDPLTDELIDPWNGRADLERRILRHVSPHFAEDPLRVLRGMQFVARFALEPAPETIAICRTMTPEGLPPERLFAEWEKLLTKGVAISKGLNFLRDTGWVQYYPELERLIGCKQEPKWHPEGDVWNHTLCCLDAFATAPEKGNADEDLIVGLAVLCHDFGKPACTRFDPVKGRITSRGHDDEGVVPTLSFLQRLTNEERLLKEVPPLVRLHMRPFSMWKDHSSDGAIRRLAAQVKRIDRLLRVSAADDAGRPPFPRQPEHLEWMATQVKRLAVLDAAPKPLVQGRDLIALGLKPGPEFGKILSTAFEAQLDGAFFDLDAGVAWVKEKLKGDVCDVMKKTVGMLVGCWAMVALCADTAPFCALRFGARFTDDDKWPRMRAAIEKNRAAFDEVWFSTGVSFPPLAWHEEHARQCARAAEDLRKLGIVPSIEIQTVIGHTDAILASSSCAGQDWSTMVSQDGLAAKHLSCPSDPRLRAYFVRVAELNAAWKPGSMWVDDDLSYRNRAPMLKGGTGMAGCFCDRCVAGFAKQEGRAWTRAELVKAFAKESALRPRWDAYSCGVMGELTRAIAEAVHRVSPTTVMGYQYGGTIMKAIPYGLYEGSGLAVRLRPGAGAYYDTNPYEQIAKSYQLRQMLQTCLREDWVGACCPEIETCPRTFACRTPQGVILEAFENLALGMDFLSMFLADARTSEPIAFYADRLFPRLAAAHPFLKGYHDVNVGTVPCGFSMSGGVPAPLVAAHGIPVVGAGAKSLGGLPGGQTYTTKAFQVISSSQLTNLYARCDQACAGRMPVRFDEPVRAFVVPRVKGAGELVSVALVNASIDRQDPVVLRLRGVGDKCSTARWHEPEAKPVALPIKKDERGAFVTLPRLAAWSCGYLDFE